MMRFVDRAYRSIAAAIVAIFMLAGIGTSAANAQRPQPPAQAPTVAEFLTNPALLLQQYPNGGSRFANIVQELALADPATFKPLIALVANANDAQRRALGEGLVQATKIEFLSNQPRAVDWQQQIAAIDDPVFKTAAANASGDVQIGAVGGGPLGGNGGGPLGGNGGGPGPGPSGSGPLESLRSNPVLTPQFTISSSVTGLSSPSFPVSP